MVDVLFLGELSLDGSLRHLQRVLPRVGPARDPGIPINPAGALLQPGKPRAADPRTTTGG